MRLIILGIIISYLVGSIPTAYLWGILFRGIDIRKFGSGNIGATNALRVLGKKAGLSVLLIDILKGALPVIIIGDYILARRTVLSTDAYRILLGISCICGHNWTVFLSFKGGKGVATTFGVLIAFSLKIAGFTNILTIVILVWLLTFTLSQMISLASILAAISFPATMLLFQKGRSLLAFSFLTAIFILLRHRSNLIRIFRGEERRLNFFCRFRP